jgi:cobalamin biosynthesis protein CbiG
MTDVQFDAVRCCVLGLGCERGTSPEEMLTLALDALSAAGIRSENLAAVASIDSRVHETAILAAARHLDVSTVFFDAPTLEKETPRLKNPSDVVFRQVGCHGVAEAAALAAIGESAVLIMPKMKSLHATAAIARMALQKK